MVSPPPKSLNRTKFIKTSPFQERWGGLKMAAKTISLEFNGYWLEKDMGGIPKQSGIYVYMNAHITNRQIVFR